MANIIDKSKPIWMHCKNCGRTFRMGGSCECGNVRTKQIEDGAFFIEGDSDDIIYETD